MKAEQVKAWKILGERGQELGLVVENDGVFLPLPLYGSSYEYLGENYLTLDRAAKDVEDNSGMDD